MSAILLGACAAGQDGPSGGSTGADAPNASTPVVVVGSSRCDEPAAIGLGRWRGDLAAASVALQGLCGAPGPVAYFAVDLEGAGDVAIEASADAFTPRVGVKFEHCDAPWSVCGDGGPLWLTNVAAGTTLIVAVSVPVDEYPPAWLDGTGLPFDVTLGLRARRIVAAGEACLGDVRCEAGTRCVEADAMAVPVCVSVPGDLCSTALEIELEASSDVVLEPVPEPRPNDDHHHSCGGEDVPEWVYRLVRPNAEPGVLRISGSEDAMLAVRGASCLPEDELACGSGVLELENTRWNGQESLFLFVESLEAPSVRLTWTRP